MSRLPIAGGTRLHKLLLEGRPYSIGKQQILQSTGDRQVVSVIISGFVRKYLITNDGSIGVMIIYGPGDIFPLTLLYEKIFNLPLYSGAETFFYEAMSQTEVRTTDTSRLIEMIKEDSGLYQDLFQEAGRHLEFCIQSIENVSLRNSGKRVAHFLLYFARKFGSQKKDGVHINMPLTHQSIAEILNLTRETVSTSIIKLRKKRLIKTDKKIIIVDIKKLQEEAYG